MKTQTAKHNWHLDADGVEVAKGQGEGVPEQRDADDDGKITREEWRRTCPLPIRDNGNLSGTTR